ncbi:pseudouridine synthase [Candidatus Termititenax persephonae]|uniref:Pseudouridine synthase n=1 Tax=Candidatus Termititenax persephonae TaxID=2218525 RepID=A0A388TIC5_9BACT|nr:pseudouridine synthase [Candidatus Termititenax persephonae]
MLTQRLDKWIGQKYGISRALAASLIDKGLVVWPAGKKLKNSLPLTEAEFAQCQVTLPPVQKTAIRAQDIPLNIIYEDEDVIVIHKPVGLVVHPACGNPENTLVNALLFHCQDWSGINGQERPGIVHRLDKDTEGLLVAAKHDAAHKFLSKQFERHSITRKYLALVSGNVVGDSGVISGNLRRSRQDRQKVAVVSSGGKKAVTHYKVLKRFNSMTLIEAELETGRTHQIRVHLAYLGHPLIGDKVYNADYQKKNTHQCLIAYKLGFIHPRTKKYLEFDAELPAWTKK